MQSTAQSPPMVGEFSQRRKRESLASFKERMLMEQETLKNLKAPQEHWLSYFHLGLQQSAWQNFSLNIYMISYSEHKDKERVCHQVTNVCDSTLICLNQKSCQSLVQNLPLSGSCSQDCKQKVRESNCIAQRDLQASMTNEAVASVDQVSVSP